MQESAIMENRRMTRHDRRMFDGLVLTKGGGYSIQLSGEINGIIRRRESHGIFEARSSGRDGKIHSILLIPDLHAARRRTTNRERISRQTLESC